MSLWFQIALNFSAPFLEYFDEIITRDSMRLFVVPWNWLLVIPTKNFCDLTTWFSFISRTDKDFLGVVRKKKSVEFCKERLKSGRPTCLGFIEEIAVQHNLRFGRIDRIREISLEKALTEISTGSLYGIRCLFSHLSKCFTLHMLG